MLEAETALFVAAANPLEVREAALLRRFAITGKLSKREIAEIQHIFPPGLVIFSRLPVGVQYQKEYSAYAEIYDVGLSTVKWWIKKGKEHEPIPKPPPLDSPKAMPLWWSEIMSQKCPENILIAARNDNLQDVSFSAASKGAAAAIPGKASAAAVTVPTDEPWTEGFPFHLRNLRRQYKEALAELDEAKKAEPRDEARIIAANRRYLQVEGNAQQAEQKAPEILRKLGLLLDRDELANTLGPMLKALGEGILAVRRRVQKDLQNAGSEEEADAIWHGAIYALFDELQRSGYVCPFKLAA